MVYGPLQNEVVVDFLTCFRHSATFNFKHGMNGTYKNKSKTKRQKSFTTTTVLQNVVAIVRKDYTAKSHKINSSLSIF